jgi:hypothetical protein
MNNFLNIALRVEWCKTRARAHRWQEECLLLAEEIRRVLAYFNWRMEWWKENAANAGIIFDNIKDINPGPIRDMLERANSHIIAGKRAYALRQADIQLRMHNTCQSKWEGLHAQLTYMADRDAQVMVECH